MGRLRQMAFAVARSPAAGSLVRFGFARLDRLLPLTVLARRSQCAVYVHPRPSYRRHRIAVPLVAVPDVLILAHPRYAALRRQLFGLVEDEAGVDGSALLNAGPRQDVAQLHVHLTDDPMDQLRPGDVHWPSWESAVCGLSGLGDIQARYAAGFTLLRRAGSAEIELV